MKENGIREEQETRVYPYIALVRANAECHGDPHQHTYVKPL